ncbi:MAG TPA: hypothetical protein VGV36_09275 [Solirubrobacteraceae bacterium]|nr:hypothetical protein [Solirubrobacteraceae bacterium]
MDWRDPEARTDPGYARGWFNWGGLNGEVVLERLAAVRLDRLQVRTKPIPGGSGAAWSSSPACTPAAPAGRSP